MQPFITRCSDYHDFDLVQLGVDCAIGKKSKFKEITLLFDDEDEGEYDPYWAIFYIGKCPLSKNEYKYSDIEKLNIDIYMED